MEKPLETAWVGLKVGWGRASGNHQGRANIMNQVDGVSDMAPMAQPALWLCWRRAQRRNNGLCQHFCLGDSCSKALILMLYNSVPPHMSLSGAFQSAAPELDLRGSESE